MDVDMEGLYLDIKIEFVVGSDLDIMKIVKKKKKSKSVDGVVFNGFYVLLDIFVKVVKVEEGVV